MIDYKKLGIRHREIRKNKGLTQEKLAENVDVGTTHISHIETGNTIPSLQLIINIANILECTLDELFFDEIKQVDRLYDKEFGKYLQGCSDKEIKIITSMVKNLADELKSNRENG